MEISPLEIQKQSFSKAFRGYSVDEVRAFLHMVSEEIEGLLKKLELLARENSMLREDVAENQEREGILKDTLLAAQKVSDDVRNNARREAELIIKDAELLSEKMISHAMSRIGELERVIQDMKIERKSVRNKVQTVLDTFQQVLALDVEQEANELPLTQLHRRIAAENGD
ncbi:MAG: DivIVA domain-containing protein [Acidobacteria bacterium]|nr:DivIVA domain-containing protein [Acidobacteriota bacterium]